MSTLVTVLHVIVCLFLMLTVLLQSGKGGGMGAAFGGGNAATVFGGSGASNFLKRLTAVAGTIFMITSMVLAFLSSRNSADALDSFGKEQKDIANEKADAKTRALKAAKANQGSGSGSGAGSGSAGSASVTPLTPLGAGSADIEAPIVTPELPSTGSDTGSASTGSAAGSATPAAGSAAKPATGSAAPAAGSAAKPATPAAGSAAKPAAPAAGSAAKPAAPAAGSAAKPATPAPTPAPAGSGSSN